MLKHRLKSRRLKKIKQLKRKLKLNLKLNYVLPARQCTLFGKDFIDLR